MIKWLLTLGIIVLALMLWFGKGRRSGAARGNPPRPKPGAQAMVSCAHCGLHLPRAEAVSDAGGRLFCSEAHRLAGSDRP